MSSIVISTEASARLWWSRVRDYHTTVVARCKLQRTVSRSTEGGARDLASGREVVVASKALDA